MANVQTTKESPNRSVGRRLQLTNLMPVQNKQEFVNSVDDNYLIHCIVMNCKSKNKNTDCKIFLGNGKKVSYDWRMKK